MSTFHPTAANEIKSMASAKIKQMLREVSLVVRLAMSEVSGSFGVPGSGQNGQEHKSIGTYVAGQFREFANDFEREMTAELRGWMVDGLLTELSELDGTSDAVSLAPMPNARSEECVSAREEGTEEALEKVGDKKSNGRMSVNQNEVRLTAAIPQGRVVRFLERHDFEYVPTRTGEMTYRHRPTQRKVSVPKHRCDLNPYTLRNILRDLSDIFCAKVRVVKGDLVVLSKASQPNSNGKRVLKGGLD